MTSDRYRTVSLEPSGHSLAACVGCMLTIIAGRREVTGGSQGSESNLRGTGRPGFVKHPLSRSVSVLEPTKLTWPPLELAQRASFVNPFIIACGTKNAKFTSIAIVCLQRLIVSRALPRSRLSQALEALQQATSAGLDVQLKILQALPSLVSNYAADLKGDLLVTALNICFILQSSKNAIVNNTSAATLQQLVVSVFDKVVTEDSTINRSSPLFTK